FRIVGCAEFAGHDLNINRKKIQRLHQLTKSVYPDLAPVFDSSEKNPWAGLRPVSADGLPYIGETPANGLWINCGHGHLGWTLATGSAELLADLITKKPTKIGSSPFAVVR
ncbi:MAG: FAD-dependent oxidoreductase, partial [Alphaproteobacteria bacterium]